MNAFAVDQLTLEDRAVLAQSTGMLSIFEDPISFEIMEKAMMTPCGHSFSEDTITGWLQTNTHCPLCNKTLKKYEVVPNYALRTAIARFITAQKHLQQNIQNATARTPISAECSAQQLNLDDWKVIRVDHFDFEGELPTDSKVLVELISARDLKADWFGNVNPYCTVEFQDQKKKSRVIHRARSPKFEETFVFNVRNSHTEESIVVTLWDKDRILKDRFLGMVLIPLPEVVTTQKMVRRFPLRKKRPDSRKKIRGDVLIRVHFLDLRKTQHESVRSDKSITATVSVSLPPSQRSSLNISSGSQPSQQQEQLQEHLRQHEQLRQQEQSREQSDQREPFYQQQGQEQERYDLQPVVLPPLIQPVRHPQLDEEHQEQPQELQVQLGPPPQAQEPQSEEPSQYERNPRMAIDGSQRRHSQPVLAVNRSPVLQQRTTSNRLTQLVPHRPLPPLPSRRISTLLNNDSSSSSSSSDKNKYLNRVFDESSPLPSPLPIRRKRLDIDTTLSTHISTPTTVDVSSSSSYNGDPVASTDNTEGAGFNEGDHFNDGASTITNRSDDTEKMWDEARDTMTQDKQDKQPSDIGTYDQDNQSSNNVVEGSDDVSDTQSTKSYGNNDVYNIDDDDGEVEEILHQRRNRLNASVNRINGGSSSTTPHHIPAIPSPLMFDQLPSYVLPAMTPPPPPPPPPADLLIRPPSRPTYFNVVPNEDDVKSLTEMGFSDQIAQFALKVCNNDMNVALEKLLNHGDGGDIQLDFLKSLFFS